MSTSLVRRSLMPPLIQNVDMPWTLSIPALWICIEGSLVIICGCLPVLRLFLKHTCPRLIGEYGSETTAARSGGETTNPTANGPAELSNLERSKSGRSKRYYSSRMMNMTQGPTSVQHENCSETSIITRHEKNITFETVERLDWEREWDSTELIEQAGPERPLYDGLGVFVRPT
ncbi:hypothetical protein BST61_g11131 [Cercospora zeina]